jgi:hypothetical protein
MKQFTRWLLESVGRFLTDDLDAKLQDMAQKIADAVPQVYQTREPVSLGQLMSKRMNSETGKTQRFLRTFEVVYDDQRIGAAWDDERSNKVVANAFKLKGRSADAIYSILVHELIHSTDPRAGELTGSSADMKLDNDADYKNYYSLRHEFDAFSGMITNWIVRKMKTAEEAKAFLQNAARGRSEGLPPDLAPRFDRFMKLDPKLRNKFLRRVYEAVKLKMSGQKPRTSVPLNRGVHQQPGYTGEDVPQTQQPAYVPKTTQ